MEGDVVSVRFTDDEMKMLNELSDELMLPISVLIRAAVKNHYDLMMD